MLFRVLTLAGGLTGAAALSQFPEYSQQYTQRLAGKVEELTRFVEAFEADAAKVGISPQEALVELAQSGEIGAARAQTMASTLARKDRLSTALSELRGAGPFERAIHANAFADSELARGTLGDFKPAIPLSAEGLIFALIGFLGGLGVAGAAGWLLRGLLRPRKSVGETA